MKNDENLECDVNPLIWQEKFLKMSEKAKELYFYLYFSSDCQGDNTNVRKISNYIGATELNLKELIKNGYAHSNSNLDYTRIFGKLWLCEKDGECYSIYDISRNTKM